MRARQRKMKDSIVTAILFVLSALLFLASAFFIGFVVYVKIRYWGTPIGEIPYWAWWLMN